MKISFACGLLGKCHSLSAEQRGPVSVMHHLETGVGANLSQYCHILMGCRNLTAKPTERERERVESPCIFCEFVFPSFREI